jgi:hypothetical protein
LYVLDEDRVRDERIALAGDICAADPQRLATEQHLLGLMLTVAKTPSYGQPAVRELLSHDETLDGCLRVWMRHPGFHAKLLFELLGDDGVRYIRERLASRGDRLSTDLCKAVTILESLTTDS